MSSRNINKLVFGNLIVFFVVLLTPGSIYKIYTLTENFRNVSKKQSTDVRISYPTYLDKERANQIYLELLKLKTKYHSFVGWKRENVSYKFTKISGKYKTRKSLGESLNNSFWFFGGSTMWGYGESDNQTIPSHFNKLTNQSVYNFGQVGWNSRQSLNQLINLIGDELSPKKIIFYEGINDAILQCQANVKEIPNHPFEQKIRKKLSSNISWNEFTRNILKFIFDPYLKLTKSNSFSGINTKKSKYFDCDINKVKSKRIASHLINNWYIAYLIAKNNNSEFIGILQPWVLTSEVNYDYLTESEKNKLSLYKTHLDIVYENIIFEMNKACNYDKEFCKSIINGVDWLKNKENVFIDFGHTNGEGNKIISEKITQLIKL